MSVQHDDWNAVADGAIARVEAWATVLADEPVGLGETTESSNRAAVRPDVLEGSRRDADALGFTRKLLDAVVGASDPFNAALNLRAVSRDLPASMPVVERLAVRAGGIASLGLPWAVLPVARKWLRDRVAHLVVAVKLEPGTGTSAEPRGAVEAGEAPEKPQQGAPAPLVAPPALRSASERAASDGSEVLWALGGTAVLGDQGVQRELSRLLALCKLPEVRALAVDAARLAPAVRSGAWSLDRDAEAGSLLLRELLEAAQLHGTSILIESHDYRSALLAPQMMAKALAAPGLERVRVGVVLPAELPESVQTAEALIGLSQARVASGAEPLEIVVGVAGFVGREQVKSILSGLAIPALEDRVAQQAQLVRIVRTLLEAGAGVHTVIAAEDPHLLAAATVLAERHGRSDALTLQLRAGISSRLEAAIAEHGFRVRRRMVLVHTQEFAGAIEYLIALAAETADEDSAIAHVRSLSDGEAAELGVGARRLREVIRIAAAPAPPSRRLQHRAREWSEEARDTVVFYRSPAEPNQFETGGLTAAVLSLTRAHTGAITLEVAGAPLRIPVISESGFANEPETDASRYDNREWARGLLASARTSDAGIQLVRDAEQRGEDPAALVDDALSEGEHWGQLRAADRATRVSRLALGVAAARDRLVEVLAAESGAPVPVIDNEINNVIDATRYLGQLAGGLGAVRGAQFRPDRVAAVIAEAGSPLGERAESILAALAAGSTVVCVAHPSVARSTAVLLEEWGAAGLPAGAVVLAVPAAGDDPRAAFTELAARVVVDPRVDRALVLGRRSTAKALLRRRPDLRIEGRFLAQGVVAITPSADPVLSVQHAVASAFGAMHADTTTARALLLLGPAARSDLLRRSLVDAVKSLRVGDTARPEGADPLGFEIGPLPELPDEAGLRALTTLDEGEKWLVKPEQLDEEGLLWRPGVRTGLTPSSRFWNDAIGMPVIGVINAHSVDDVISLTARIGGGGVAALYAGDPAETLPWLERASAARLVVGRPTTGGRIERQPAGGWNAAGMGAPGLAGGPHRVQALGSWELREGTASSTLHLRGLTPEVRLLIETAQPSLDYQSFDRVRRAALSDALAWRTSFGQAYDVSGLGIERNLLRHWPVSTHVRVAEGAQLGELVRVIAAGLVARAPMTVSTGIVLPTALLEFLSVQGISVALERDNDWLERISVNGPGDEELASSRIRLVGGDRTRTAEWLGGLDEVTLWAEPVTMAGPVELLAFVREQAVSITGHRDGLAFLPSGIGGWIAELQGRA